MTQINTASKKHPRAMDPAVVLVHGAWHTPNHYRDLIACLESSFSKVACPQLPSCTNELPFPQNANLAGDTAVVRQAISEFADGGHPIIVLMHSYGGLVGTNACKDLLWRQRQASNKGGGVVHIIFFTAFVQAAGSACLDPWAGELPPWSSYDAQTGECVRKDKREAFYSHVLDDAQAEEYVAACTRWPAQPLRDVQEFAPLEFVGKGLDATYVVCTEDQDLTVQLQEGMASLLGEKRAMRTLAAGHCAQVGFAEEIGGIVREGWESSKLRLGREV